MRWFQSNNSNSKDSSIHSQHEKTPWEMAQEEQQIEQTKVATDAPKWFSFPSFAKQPVEHKERNEYTIIKKRLMMISAAVLAWGIYFVSPLAKPQQIIVVGTTQTDETEIVTHSGISVHQSIWSILLEEATISNSLETYTPKINRATVALSGINTIVLTVEENPAVGHFERDGKYFEVLANQEIIEVGTESPVVAYPKLEGFPDDEFIKTLATQLAVVPVDIIIQIDRIHYKTDTGNKNGIELEMKDGMKVIADLTTLGTRLVYYNDIKQQLGEQKGTIDMEVGIFFIPN